MGLFELWDGQVMVIQLRAEEMTGAIGVVRWRIDGAT